MVITSIEGKKIVFIHRPLHFIPRSRLNYNPTVGSNQEQSYCGTTMSPLQRTYFCHDDCPSLQRTHQEFKHGPATWANQLCRTQPVVQVMSWRGTLVELATVNAIQLTIRHKEKLLKMAPSCSANECGCSQPVVICMNGRMPLMKLAVFDAVQYPLGIEE